MSAHHRTGAHRSPWNLDAFDDLTHVHALKRDRIGEHAGDSIRNGPSLILGLEDAHAPALAVDPDPVRGNQARRLLHTWHDLVSQMVRGRFPVVDSDADYYCVHGVPFRWLSGRPYPENGVGRNPFALSVLRPVVVAWRARLGRQQGAGLSARKPGAEV